MPCYSPLEGWKGAGGRVVFKRQDAIGPPVTLPCGQCIGCRLRYSQAWALRCVHEAQLHDANCFITLTYDNEHLPADGSVCVSRWQSFAKRLREAIGPFRFVQCGEYGDINLRPHYHALIFGKTFPDLEYLQGKPPLALFRSGILEKVWKKGFCTVGELTYDSAAYVARYVLKKWKSSYENIEDDPKNPYSRFDPVTGEVWQVKPEFMNVSRRPGIGSGWFDKFYTDVYPADEVVLEGKRHRPPKYYDSRFDRIMEEEMARIKSLRAEKLKRTESGADLRRLHRVALSDAVARQRSL